MKPVNSESIKAVGHDPETSVLSVQFHSGQTYRYAGVSADVAARMLSAESVGKHFMKHIRGAFKVVK